MEIQVMHAQVIILIGLLLPTVAFSKENYWSKMQGYGATHVLAYGECGYVDARNSYVCNSGAFICPIELLKSTPPELDSATAVVGLGNMPECRFAISSNFLLSMTLKTEEKLQERARTDEVARLSFSGDRTRLPVIMQAVVLIDDSDFPVWATVDDDIENKSSSDVSCWNAFGFTSRRAVHENCTCHGDRRGFVVMHEENVRRSVDPEEPCVDLAKGSYCRIASLFTDKYRYRVFVNGRDKCDKAVSELLSCPFKEGDGSHLKCLKRVLN